MTQFTDDELFFWKNLAGNHEQDEDIENLEIHPGTLRDLLARLEAAERFIKHYNWEHDKRWVNCSELKAYKKAAGK